MSHRLAWAPGMEPRLTHAGLRLHDAPTVALGPGNSHSVDCRSWNPATNRVESTYPTLAAIFLDSEQMATLPRSGAGRVAGLAATLARSGLTPQRLLDEIAEMATAIPIVVSDEIAQARTTRAIVDSLGE